MKPHSHKRTALLVLTLLLLGVGLSCFLWVRKEQRQYALNRQLITALKKNDSKQALSLVEAGADPNTQFQTTFFPSVPEMINQLTHRSPSAGDEHTAFTWACGDVWQDKHVTLWPPVDGYPQLTQAMILHGAKINAKYNGTTVLGMAVNYRHKATVKQLLAHGADPNESDRGAATAIEIAEHGGWPELVPLLRKYSKHP